MHSGRLSEDSLEEGVASGVAPRHFKSKLEEALTAKQESEAKVGALEDKVKQYEVGVEWAENRVCEASFDINQASYVCKHIQSPFILRWQILML